MLLGETSSWKLKWQSILPSGHWLHININKYNKLAYILIIITYTIFGYLTFKPIKCKLFKDTIENKYGINTYII